MLAPTASNGVLVRMEIISASIAQSKKKILTKHLTNPIPVAIIAMLSDG